VLISEQYREQQAKLHESTNYGMAAGKYFGQQVAQIIDNLEINHLLDYGCGSRLSLAEGLKAAGVKRKFTYQAYDPCVPAHSSPPVPAEFVCCIDVLEHIEEDSIDEVLDHLASLTTMVGLFSVDCGPAFKFMADGRNAHILQRPPEWWLPRIMARFELQTFQITWRHRSNLDHVRFYVIVHPRGAIEDAAGRKLS
jgi:hypothetical protein